MIASSCIRYVRRESTYNPAARSVTVQDWSEESRPETLTCRFDPVGRLVEQTRSGSVVAGDSGSRASVSRWSYDVDGDLTCLTRPNGVQTLMSRDAVGRVSTVTTGAKSVHHGYDNAGRMVTAETAESAQQWVYDTGGFLAQHLARAQDGFRKTQLRHDEMGRLSSVTRDGKRVRYDYDESNQLVSVASGKGAHSLVYDAAGQLVSESGGRDAVYDYNQAGELVASVIDGERTSYAYDSAGRRVVEESAKGRVRYTWNALGWLEAVNGPDGTWSAHVNALGELARVNDTALFWDNGLTQTGDATVTVTAGYSNLDGTWSPHGHRDTRPTDPADPWTPRAASLGGLMLGSHGQVMLPGGMEWMNARVYDPSTRGFLSPDPLDPVSGAGWAGNTYSYAGNNPVGLSDPTGMSPTGDDSYAMYYHGPGKVSYNNGIPIIEGYGIDQPPNAIPGLQWVDMSTTRNQDGYTYWAALPVATAQPILDAQDKIDNNPVINFFKPVKSAIPLISILALGGTGNPKLGGEVKVPGGSSSGTTTVYRVEGPGNARVKVMLPVM